MKTLAPEPQRDGGRDSLFHLEKEWSVLKYFLWKMVDNIPSKWSYFSPNEIHMLRSRKCFFQKNTTLQHLMTWQWPLGSRHASHGFFFFLSLVKVLDVRMGTSQPCTSYL